jgi:hypothetical protein
MKVGDLVWGRDDGDGLLGIIVGWNRSLANSCPIVHWNDGRTSWVMPHLIKVIA